METDPEIALPCGDTAKMWARAASRTAAVALTFCGVVLALLLFGANLIKSSDPFNHPGIASLVDQLQAADQAHQAADVSRLVTSIRALDISARTQFFKAHAATQQGWVLLGLGALVFVLSAKAASLLQRPTPMPAATPPETATAAVNVSIRNAVAALMVVTALVLLIASYAAPDRQAAPVPSKQAHE